MSKVSDIFDHGNRGHDADSMVKAFAAEHVLIEEGYDPSNIITCADGYSFSLIVGYGVHCIPRPGWPLRDVGAAPEGFPGPYTHGEIGFPTARPEPWECGHGEGCFAPRDPDEATGWACYVEYSGRHPGQDDPTEAIYSYVPRRLVELLVSIHGGEA